jgi:hypothetical protein
MPCPAVVMVMVRLHRCLLGSLHPMTRLVKVGATASLVEVLGRAGAGAFSFWTEYKV